MTYIAPGIRPISPGRLLPALARHIIEGCGGGEKVEATLSTVLLKESGINSSTTLNNVIEEQIVAISASPTVAENFQAGSPYLRSLHKFLFHYLNALGIFTRVPASLEFRKSPYITFDDAIDAVLESEIVFPTPAEIGLERLRWGGFVVTMPRLLRRLAWLTLLRKTIASKLRLHLSDIGYRLNLGMDITAHEKSFFLRFHDVTKAHARMAGEERGPDLRAAPNESNYAVAETFAKLCARTEPGPFSRFVRLNSNTTRDALTYYWGPHVGAITTSYGYEETLGSFNSYEFMEVDTVPWDLGVQIAATRERYAAVQGAAAGGGAQAGLFFDNPIAVASEVQAQERALFNPDYDEPEFYIRMQGRSDANPKLTSFDIDWTSHERGRVITTGLGGAFSVGAWVIETALYNQNYGQGLLGDTDISKYPLIDRGSSPDLEPFFGVARNLVETIYLPDAKSHTVRAVGVDMADFYARKGLLTFKSAFSDYVLCPMAWLLSQDAPAEEYIMARLGFTREARTQGENAVRMSHNYARLARTFGRASLPAVDIKQLIGVYAGYSNKEV